MKYLKMLGLAAVAAAALMALVGVGTASAAGGVLCSTTANPCPEAQRWAKGTVIDFSLKAGSSAKLVNAEEPTETLDTCTGTVTIAEEEKAEKEGKKVEGTTVKGSLTANPDATGTATGTNTSLRWKGCTFPTNTLAAGALKVERIGATSNGTVIADAEAKVTINTFFFGSCVYGVKAGAHLGVITEGKGTAAEFKAESAPAEKIEGAICPPKSLWTANYVLTTPSETTLSVSSS